MKNYRDLMNQIQTLTEGAQLKVDDTSFTNEIPKADDGTVNLYDPNVPEAVDRLNAALCAINQKSVLNPRERVNEIRMALAHGGIDFDPTEVAIVEGEQVVPAKLYGGFIGMDDDGEFKNESGFERKTGKSWGVKFEWSKYKGMWSLEAEIMPV
jgi:hypothetical protein